MRTLDFAVTVWGEAYVETFLTLALPSFLAPDNIPACAKLVAVRFMIATRSEDVPTIKEAGYDIRIPLQPRGIVGPPKMSPAAAEYYRKLFAKMIETPSWKKYVEETRVQTSYIAADDLAAFLANIADGTRNALKSANIEVIR